MCHAVFMDVSATQYKIDMSLIPLSDIIYFKLK